MVKINHLYPSFHLAQYAFNEEIKLEDVKGLHASLKEYREELELDNHVICDEEETQQIINDGLNLYGLIENLDDNG